MLNDPALRDLFDRLGTAYAVGGCVRDTLMRIPHKDVDIATPLTPDEVQVALAGSRFDLYPTGIDHGTWTVRDPDSGSEFEVTTFRRDVATDGRRATIAFADTMEEDAQRRDFTMNALYMDRDGKVHDPTGTGIMDTSARLLRFVGDASERCREDYLRILRLYRFRSRYDGAMISPSARDAASIHAEGLKDISGERIWAELKKILGADAPADTLSMMASDGVLGVVLPEANVRHIFALQRCDSHIQPRWERWHFLLMGREIPFPHANAEKAALDRRFEAAKHAHNPAVAAFLTGDGDAVEDAILVQRSVTSDPKLYSGYPEEVRRGLASSLPISARDIMDAGVPQGPEIGEILRTAVNRFVRDSLQTDRATLLSLAIPRSV